MEKAAQINENEEFEFRLRMEKESAQPAPPAPSQPASFADKLAGGMGGRMVLGAASPLLAGTQLIGGEKGRELVADIEASKRRGMRHFGKDGTDWMGILGALLPAGLAAGAVTKALPAATGVLGRAGLGAAQGAAVSAATPVTEGQPQDFWSDKATQVGTGATVGGLIPLAVDAVKGVANVARQFIDPLREEGQKAIASEIQKGLLNNDKRRIAESIQTLRQAKEIVPGSPVTSGEALADLPGSTGLMALMERTSRIPGVSPEFAETAAKQRAARASALGNIAEPYGNTLADAVKARERFASKAYADAYNVILNDRLPRSLASNPYIKKALPVAMDLAEVKRIDPKTNLTQFLHYVKIGLDKQLAKTGEGALHSTEKEAVEETRRNLLGWLEKKNPLYADARIGTMQAYRPENRMKVGQVLQQALDSPLGTSERVQVFAKAADDAARTIKRATGQSIYDKLDDVLQPQEVTAVKQVADELARHDKFTRLASETRLPGQESLAGNIEPSIPNLLWRPSMLANFALRHAGKKAQGQLEQLLSQQALSPTALADSLEYQAVPFRYQPVIDALMRQAVPSTVTTTARQF